ncbi:MAG: leucine-rich repeat protein [Clostridia bacterium]|nr:leucine-rich repeat protein [Clostridia bacterium]
MKRKLKKAMSILLAFTLLFGSFAFGLADVDWADFAVKAKAMTLGDYTYSTGWLGIRIISVNKSISGDVVVPAYFTYELADGKIEVAPVAYIGENAFKNCTAIKSITLPDTVCYIYREAFYGCTSLESITLSRDLKEIGYMAFKNCKSLKSIEIPDGVTTIGSDAFCNCENLESATLPDSITELYDSVFKWCKKLESITIPDRVTKIGSDAFGYCESLTNITIPEGVTKIDNRAFNYCKKLKSVTLPSTLTIIGESAFCGCIELESIKLPKNVIEIGSSAFSGCSKLERITIPAAVTSIGSSAFYGCDALKSITVESENTAYSSDEHGVLFNKDKTKLIKYPAGSTNEIYYVPDGVTSVDNYAFHKCNFLKSIIFPDSITELVPTYVWNCANLECVHIPKSVTSISSNFLKDTNAYICSTTENCSAKEFADANGIEFRVCTGHNAFIPEPTTKPVVTEPATTKPVEVPTITEPSTTKPVEVPTTTKPVVTEPSTTKPVEVPSTTKPVEAPTTTKPVVEPTKPSATVPSTTKPTTKPVVTTKPTAEPTTKPSGVGFIFKILEPSVSVVKYGETLILHTNLTSISAAEKIEWSVEGEGVTIKPSADGMTCAVTSTSTGDVTVTAKYTDASGVEHVSEQEIESNASFWQKIVSFFKNLFGINRIIEQRIKF